MKPQFEKQEKIFKSKTELQGYMVDVKSKSKPGTIGFNCQLKLS